MKTLNVETVWLLYLYFIVYELGSQRTVIIQKLIKYENFNQYPDTFFNN